MTIPMVRRVFGRMRNWRIDASIPLCSGEGVSAASEEKKGVKWRHRPNVAAILERPDGMILVAKRYGLKDAWQFPQGGVDEGEGIEEALYREVEEEVGLGRDRYEILDRRDGYQYRFPNGRMKRGYHGQEQTYFRCRYLGTDSDIDLEAHSSQEFDDFRWIEPGKFKLSWVPKFKREVYARVFGDFFGVNL
jgi:putative (di)nucleoside polyphosphate hydrolase